MSRDTFSLHEVMRIEVDNEDSESKASSLEIHTKNCTEFAPRYSQRTLYLKQFEFVPEVDGFMHILSGFYAQLLLLIAGITIFGELLHGNLPLFHLQEYVFIYLLGFSIALLASGFVKEYRLRSQVSRSKNSSDLSEEWVSDEKMIEKRFSYIDPLFQVGVIVFGSVLFISFLLEFIAIYTSPEKCVSKATEFRLILCCVFVLLQVLLMIIWKKAYPRFNCIQSLILMHLFACNATVWIHLTLWESAKDWEEALHLKHNSSMTWNKNEFNFTVHSLESDIDAIDESKHYPQHAIHYTSNCWWRTQKSNVQDVISVNVCLQNSTAGVAWNVMNRFLYPLMVQYFFVIACVLYIFWAGFDVCASKFVGLPIDNSKPKCLHHSAKGFFGGMLVLTMTFITLIVFFTVYSDLKMLLNTFYCFIYAISAFSAISALIQMKKLNPFDLFCDFKYMAFFQKFGMSTIYFYSVSNAFAAVISDDHFNFAFVFESALMIIQATTQFFLLLKASTKKISESSINTKPGRQSITFLIFTNFSLWLLDCFVSFNNTIPYQVFGFGNIVWPLIKRLIFPFVIFHRYHSVLFLFKVWKNCYE